MAGIAITRRELMATELRAAAGKTQDARAARRIREPSGGWFPRRTGAPHQRGRLGGAQEPDGAAGHPAGAGRPAGSHRQGGPGAVKRLHLAFLLNAKGDGPVRRGQIRRGQGESDDVGQFFDAAGAVASLNVKG